MECPISHQRETFAPAASQLPVHVVFRRKASNWRSVIFDAGPGYAGHELMVPELGNYRTLEMAGPRAHAGQERRCGVAHVQRLPPPPGPSCCGAAAIDRTVVCPIHRWTYDRQGELIGAPHFPQNPACLGQKLESWNGLLFAGPRSANADLGGMNIAGDFDFSGYKLDRSRSTSATTTGRPSSRFTSGTTTSCRIHPGLGSFVTCDDLTWQFGDWYSVQRVGITTLQKSGSKTYERWQRGGARLRHGQAEAGRGVADLLPQHHGRVVPARAGGVDADPADVDKTTNVVEFYYPEDIALFEREFVEPSRPPTWNGDRGRRHRRAHGPRPPGADEGKGATRSVRTSHRWKTACSTSTSSIAASWANTCADM